jgi:hypothetical protein
MGTTILRNPDVDPRQRHRRSLSSYFLRHRQGAAADQVISLQASQTPEFTEGVIHWEHLDGI